MKINPAEITRVIQERIQSYELKLEMVSTGTVIQVGDGIARVYGIEKCMYAECSNSKAASMAWRLTWNPTTWASCFWATTG